VSSPNAVTTILPMRATASEVDPVQPGDGPTVQQITALCIESCASRADTEPRRPDRDILVGASQGQIHPMAVPTRGQHRNRP